ncbi:MAG: hypothetical protein WD066_07325 [Planctomycetaceae bacterium]
MAEKQSIPEHDLSRHPLGHEPDRVSILGILWTGFGVVLLVLFAVAATWGFLDFTAPRMKVAERVGARPAPRERLSEPSLDPHQPAELEALRRREDAVLSSYGWIDEERGIARVPIDRAIEMLAERQRARDETAPPREEVDP